MVALSTVGEATAAVLLLVFEVIVLGIWAVMRGPELRGVKPVRNGCVVAALAALLWITSRVVAGQLNALEGVFAFEAAVLTLVCALKFKMDTNIWTAPATLRLTGRVAIVTGGNSGIGLETARILVRLGATVIIACRSEERGTAAAADLNRDAAHGGSVTYMPLDLAAMANARAFVREFRSKYDRLDILVNNAGASLRNKALSKDGLEGQLGMMHFAHFIVTTGLEDMLLASGTSEQPSRVVTTASFGHTFGHFDKSLFEGNGEGDLRAEKTFKTMECYGRAKLANVLMAIELQRRWNDRGIAHATSHTLHPGAVYTNIWPWQLVPTALLRAALKYSSMFAMRGSHPAAQIIAGLLLDPSTGQQGGWYSDCYFGKHNATSLTEEARSEKLAKRLWEVSERVTSE